MHKEGAKIIGIIEKDVAIYNSQGLIPDEVKIAKELTGSVKNYPEYEEIETFDPSTMASKKCHIFAPCADYGTLNSHFARQLNTKLVIELASSATTYGADEILNQRGISIIPDMLTNIGPMATSYMEWLKNLDHVSPGRMTKKF